MRASEIVKEVQNILHTRGDFEVDVSVAKQPAVKKQQYLVADARFIVVEEHEGEEDRIVIRDWPY